MDFTSIFIGNVIDYMSLIDIIDLNLIKHERSIISRLFREYKMKYFEDFFDHVSDEDCLKILKVLSNDEIKKYINDEVNYDDDAHYQTTSYHIIEKLCDNRLFKSVFYIFDNEIIDCNECYNEVFSSLIKNNDINYMELFLEKYLSKINGLYFHKQDIEKVSTKLLLFILKFNTEKMCFYKNFGAECLSLKYNNEIYFEIFEKFAKSNVIKNESSARYYMIAINMKDLELMDYLYENDFQMKTNSLYDYAEGDVDTLRWLYKHKLKPTKVQKTKYSLTKL